METSLTLQQAIDLSDNLIVDGRLVSEAYCLIGGNLLLLPQLIVLDPHQTILIDEIGRTATTAVHGDVVNIQFFKNMSPALLVEPTTSQTAKVLVTVSEGLVEYTSEGDVMVAVFDFDGYEVMNKELREQAQLSHEWAELGAQASVPYRPLP
jgi:hypothetical protein